MRPDFAAEQTLWDDEYTTRRVIPSSTRTLPSKAFLVFNNLLDLQVPGVALDVGCGNGRNSVFLAAHGWSVDAIDFSQAALTRLHEAADRSLVSNRIRAWHTSIEPPLSFPSGSFDLVLDSYVLCHFADEEFKQGYRDELFRLTKPGRFVFSSLFDVDDEYYNAVGQVVNAACGVVVDPMNGIRKQLYTPYTFKEFYAERFAIVYFVKFEFHDVVLGRTYRRSILALVGQKQ